MSVSRINEEKQRKYLKRDEKKRIGRTEKSKKYVTHKKVSVKHIPAEFPRDLE